MGKPEIPVGKSNGSPHSVGELKKNGLIKKKKNKYEAMPFFLLFLVCSANLDRLCSESFSHHFKFYSIMFTHKTSTRVVCVNGKSPWSQFRIKSLWVLSHYACPLHPPFIGQMEGKGMQKNPHYWSKRAGEVSLVVCTLHTSFHIMGWVGYSKLKNELIVACKCRHISGLSPLPITGMTS